MKLTRQDLPPGFEAISAAESGLVMGDRFDGDSAVENSFAFFGGKQAELIWGFTTLLSDGPEQADFDANLQDPAYLAAFLSQELDGPVILEQEGLAVPANIGDISAGLSLTIETEGRPQLDGIAFRRGGMGAFIFVMYTGADEPAVVIDDIARRLDERISSAGSAPAAP